jgi:AcrR family transcriptional regulator
LEKVKGVIAELDKPFAHATKRLKGAARREAILDAAGRLYVQFGPSKTTTRQIAQMVGISQPSLYAHFPTKESLSHALAIRAFALLEQRLEALPPIALGAQTQFNALIEGYIDFALEESSAYQIAFMLDLDIESHKSQLDSEHAGMTAFAIFRDKISDLQALGFIRAGPIQLIAQSIWAAMHGLCALFLARPYFPWEERAQLIAAHIDLITKGARAP